MTGVSVEAKVGVFVIIGIIILGYMSMKVGKLTLSGDKRYEVEVLFDSASGLAVDTTVEIAGVEVGRVSRIGLKDGKALVGLNLDPEISLTKDVRAVIRTKGILGDKYVELIPGSPAAPVLAAGDRIVRSIPTTDMDTLMNVLGEVARDVSQLTNTLANVMGGEEGEASLRAIISNLREMTETLNQTVQANNEDVSKMISNLAAFAETLRKIGDGNHEDIDTIVSNVRRASDEIETLVAGLNEITTKINEGEGTIGQLVNDKDTVENLNEALVSLKEVTDKIGKGEGTLGRLINDDETVENLNATLEGINDYISQNDTFRTYLDFRAEYLFDNEATKGYFSLKIQPKDDKYYLLGVVNDPYGKRTIKESIVTVDGVTTTGQSVTWERNKLTFNAQIAKRYYDLVLRGGFMESTGGVGLDYYLFNDHLTFSFEAFDFDPDKNPNLKLRTDFRPMQHLYITAGYNDMISSWDRESFFLGAGISFADEDIKALITKVPVPGN
jgi:phospholipid/cholesterol/gamma-HCH transport system substrate-binding protein